ncbi:spore germination protein [Pseudogracilibacillus auburnensis]|uniref:Stage V sporulation protein AF n=1 Tax=Pseudogracilibacillus auburnensis TaxID=1494959 RepID=A0A2V3W405_9BACI|nr:spore germination protein [Pseudogracilibacillus auburnensis]MBO1003095.1 spore germination protein [Pseudogracilibacillus auburnensis]PXW88700.1 stage V sporulation protein AF [Pseudogracilibacillus auburnensis]
MRQTHKMTYVSKHLKENKNYMKEEVGATVSYDVGSRDILILERDVTIYYVNGLVDDSTIVEILKMLVRTNDLESEEDKIYDIINNRLMNQQVEAKNKLNEVTDQLLAGLIVVFIDGERNAFIVDTRHYPGRQPEEPDTERVIRGSRDGFTENVVESTALIRRRIRDKGLRNEILHVGKRSKTDVCVSYINDIANEDYVQMVKDNIQKIDIDSLVMADKALVELSVEFSWNPFPLVRYTERPDVAAHHILSGYIVLIVDTSPSVIILPTTFFDHLEHAEEYRQAPAVGTFTRWFRIIAVLASIFLLPLWLLFVLEPSLLPKALSFIGPKEVGNIPIPIQIIMADIGVEFLRMAAVHTPTPLATALGLIAAVLIGDIAINVGMFSPEVILYVAISTIGTYVTPSYELSVANKLMKLFLLLMTIFFGVSGFIIGFTISILFLVNLKTLRTPYFWPFIPFNLPALLRFIFRIPEPFIHKRPSIVYPKDHIRQASQK